MDPAIIFFNDIRDDQLGMVGGKGLNLGIMTRAGIPVPAGFCVTSAVYKDFIGTSPASLLAGTGPEIRARLNQAPLPDYLESALAEALERYDPNTPFAVRSSATAEDLPTASFAGQQDTVLNVVSLTAILDAIRTCWVSLYSDRAIAYRAKQGMGSEQVDMAVVIQKMVASDISGIMFTADPVTQNRQVISIDAGRGLGEAMVSGLVTPDTYQYDKLARRIAGRVAGDQHQAIVTVAGGGTATVELDETTAAAPVLTDDLVHRLARIGTEIEDLYGTPQDIEWCVKSGEIAIVQSRAITSLFPLLEPACDPRELHPHLSVGHGQMMLAPISPMGLDVFRLAFRINNKSYDEYRPWFVRHAAGRAYIDLSPVFQYKPLRRPLAGFLANLDQQISGALVGLIEQPDFSRRIAKRKGWFREAFQVVHTVPPQVVRRLLRPDTDGTVERVNRITTDLAAKAIAGIPLEPSVGGAGAVHDRNVAIFGHINIFKDLVKLVAPYLAPGIIAMKRLESLERELLGSATYASAIVQGLEGNVTTEMGLLTGDLADFVRRSPALRREFEGDPATFLDRIAALPGEAEFKARLKEFLAAYGVRAAAELDIATPRWGEDPEPLINAVLSMADGMTDGQHRAEFAEIRRRALAAADEFTAAVAAKHGKRKARKVAKYVTITRDCLPIREHPKYMIMHVFSAVRRSLLETADELVAAGRLDDRSDIFMLGFWELDEAVSRGDDLRAVVAARRSDYERYRELDPPRVLTGNGEIVKAPFRTADLPDGALPGVGVSAGVVEGRARVVLDPTGSGVEKGEILVAPYTDPGWTTLFINAAGLVTEIGGLLTHGSVVAREYGIPAVVSCESATTRIRTGDRIRVDGTRGFVEFLTEPKGRGPFREGVR